MKHSKKIIKTMITILFIMLPIIDMLGKTQIKNTQLFGFSVIELLNIIIIGISIILTIHISKNRKKDIWQLIIYTSIFIIYILLHNINILKFNSDLFTRSNINIYIETYYIIRAYYMAALLLFVLIKNKDIFNIKFYVNIAKILICIISISLIALNILKLSYATYVEENSSFINYNIFDFYKSSQSPKLLSTRGWFTSANEISAILLTLLPINIYMIYKEKKKTNYLLYIIQFIAMIILGTRVSSLGAIAVSITAIIVNIIAKIIRKNKINYALIMCTILCILYYFISPVGTYMLNHEATNYNDIKDNYSQELKNIEKEDDIVKYIDMHSYDFRINKYFKTLYPIEKDVTFWVEVALRDRNLNNNTRIMKTTIINRIQELNNNKYDKYFGMGYTMNFIDVERDYIYQYYLFGIFGIIFIVPHIFILIESIIQFINKRKKIKLVESALLFMSSIICLIAAYFSGHVFGYTSPSYILVLSLAMLNCYIITEPRKGSKKYD